MADLVPNPSAGLLADPDKRKRAIAAGIVTAVVVLGGGWYLASRSAKNSYRQGFKDGWRERRDVGDAEAQELASLGGSPGGGGYGSEDYGPPGGRY